MPPDKKQLFMEMMTQSQFKTAFENAIRLIKLAIEQFDARITKRLSEIKDGYTPKKGKDYFDGKPGYTPKKGIDYFDGKTPVAGVDFPFAKDANEAVVIERVTEQVVVQVIPKIEKKLPVLGNAVRDALELLDGDERLDARFIKNLPEVTKTIIEGGYGGGYSALKDMPDVKFAGITDGQAIKWNHATGKWIPYTPSGANTNVWGETPTGSGTTFTLAHTPASGTLRVFRGGARQKITEDYTLSVATLTLLVTLDASEILLVDYEYA